MSFLISLLINPPPLKAGGWFALESEPKGAAWTKHKQGTEFHILYLVPILKQPPVSAAAGIPAQVLHLFEHVLQWGLRDFLWECWARLPPPPSPAPSSSHTEEWLQQKQFLPITKQVIHAPFPNTPCRKRKMTNTEKFGANATTTPVTPTPKQDIK